jgi:hypothetical protein
VVLANYIYNLLWRGDRLCGLVVRVPDYKPRAPVFDSRRCWIIREAVRLEWGPLSIVRMTEELVE